MKKKVSIIIPVYNGERYLARCIDSVVHQEGFDIKDVELLLLNDGSSDGSLRIIKQYKSRYPESIVVVDQKNRGVAKTRNRGIKMATASYVIFIDQDDYIDRDYLKTFHNAIEESKSDIVVGGYKRPNSEGKLIRVVTQQNTEYSKRYKISAAWAKIHRTDFLKKNNITFYDNNYGEDIIFTMLQNNKTNNIEGINYIGHNWFWNEKSVSNTSQRGLKDNIKIRELLHDMIPLVRTDLDVYYLLQTGVHYLLFSGRSAHPESFVSLYESIFSIYDDSKVEYEKNRFIALGPSGALLSVRVAVSGFLLLHRLNLVGIFAKVYCNGPKK